MEELLELPQSPETWIAGAHPMTIPAKGDTPEQEVWVLAVQSNEKHFVLAVDTLKVPPDAQQLFWTIVDAMREPMQGDPQRPSAIEMGPNLDWPQVIPMLEQIGIEAKPHGPLFNLNTIFQHLSIQLTGNMLPNLPIQEEK